MLPEGLAIELKEAGFPQNLHEANEVDWIGENFGNDPTDYVLNPSLGELLEACGGEKCTFTQELAADRKGSNWIATKADTAGVQGHGSSPEIAVAQVWLALHKNVGKLKREI